MPAFYPNELTIIHDWSHLAVASGVCATMDAMPKDFAETLTYLEQIGGAPMFPLGSGKNSIYAGFGDPQSGAYRVPSNAFHSLAITPGGELAINIENGCIKPQPLVNAPEDLIFVPAGNSLSFSAPVPGTARKATALLQNGAFHILFPTGLLAAKFDDLFQIEIDPAAVLPGLVSRPSNQFRFISRAIGSEFPLGKNGSRAMLDCLADALLTELARMYHAARSEPPVAGGFTHLEKRLVAKLMERSLDGSLSLKDIADHLQMPQQAFIRHFRATFNTTPSDYRMSMRLDRARQLLCDTTDSIAEIAYDCGFSSQAHLTACFSKAFDVPPAKFRANAA